MTDTRHLLQLMTWLSPSFPVGAFAYSGGLEQAVRDGRVTDADSVFAWMEALAVRGSLWQDAVLLAAAHRATAAGDRDALDEVIEFGTALSPAYERQMETLALGRAFAAAARAWNADLPANAPYPVAVGACAASLGVPPDATLVAYLQAAAANPVWAATRLMALGQSAATGLLHRLEPVILHAADAAAAAALEDIGSATLAADIAAMHHETLQPRIFRS